MKGDFLLRIVYAKRGRLAFLSHKETAHGMERVVRRAGLPYAVTEGFNPHMRSSFGPALPVGCAGDAELLDVRLRTYVPADEALARLQAAAPDGLMPLSCCYENPRGEAIVTRFQLSDWEARVGGVAPPELQAAFDALVARGFLEVRKLKQTRRGPVEKLKRVEFEGRLVAAPAVEPAPAPAVEPVAALFPSPASAAPAGQGGGDSADAGSVSAAAREAALCTWTTRDAGEGSLRPDLFVEAALSALPAAHLVSLTRTALRPHVL